MRLLIAEDETDLREVLQAYLAHAEYEVDCAENGEKALEFARKTSYDAVVMDIMMPVMDGVTALKKMRAEGIDAPVLLLTAKAEIRDRITGLDAGADDYLAKPFNAQELLARVRAMLRRREAYVPDVTVFEDLSLDKGACELRCGDRTVRLVGKTYQMMALFMENPHILYSVQQLMDRVWGWDTEAEINVVWVNISTLRKKLAELNTAVEIRMHRGTGYSLEKKA